MAEKTERCELCRYSVTRYLHQSQALECHLNGPRGEKMEGWSRRDDGVWPTVQNDDWCGQFKPDEAKLADIEDRRRMYAKGAL